MSTPLLKISCLSKSFHSGKFFTKSVKALQNVDLEVNSSEIRGIVGESGCGKTTLARCALLLSRPSSGSVIFDGHDLLALSAVELRKKRREFQMVFQDPFAALNPVMTVHEIIEEPLIVHGIEEQRSTRIAEVMEAVSLHSSLLGRRPAELSGGQQQRVGIARSLILRPRLLIADEPTSALDASVQAQILNLLSDLHKAYGLTLILISHSLKAIHYLCSHISVMQRGRIVEEGVAESFFAAAGE